MRKIMKNRNYWKERSEALEKASHDRGASYFAQLQQQYDMASKAIQDDVNKWYARFAKNNEISMQEAKKMLNSNELKEFRWSVQEYIEKGRKNGLSGQWSKQLENASARVHISRLDSLKMQMQNHVEMLYRNESEDMTSVMKDIYTNGFYHTAYEVQKGFEKGFPISKLNKDEVNKVISKPWAADGSNFSDRIWKQRNQLISELHNNLSQAIIRGKSPFEVTDAIAKRFNVSKNQAGRLVMTEAAFFAEESSKDAYKELGVEQYEILATLDSHTSEICQDLDGQVFNMNEYEVGVTAPPFHCYCRSTTIPYFDDEFELGSERAARGEDGSTYYVPADMTYPEWEKSFVDGQTDDLKETKTDDTISLKNKISEQDNRIDELKNQFSDATDGYSYDEWFSEFSSIEEGYGDASDGDATFTKLKNLDEEIRNAEKQRSDLLLQKESRGQLDTGFPGKVPNDKLDEYNAKAFEQIKVDTGYSEEQATEFHSALKEYFGGDYASILAGEGSTVKTIRDGLDRMPVYDGTVYRGLCFSESSDYDISEFTRLKPGDKIPSKGIISSWSSDKRVAEAFGAASTQAVESSTVILECLENKTGVGVQHISSYGSREAEVLCGSKYEVLEIVTESKYDYVSRRKDLLYFSDDLTEWEDELKKQVVCVIKVKEV